MAVNMAAHVDCQWHTCDVSGINLKIYTQAGELTAHTTRSDVKVVDSII
jgi:hypothetical protein